MVSYLDPVTTHLRLVLVKKTKLKAATLLSQELDLRISVVVIILLKNYLRGSTRTGGFNI